MSAGGGHNLAVVAIPPTVSNLSPASGPAAGGGTVVITGSRFTRASGVSFGSKPASAFTVDSDTQITATVPPGPPGPVHVMVAAPIGVADISARDVYTYNGGNLYVTAWGHDGTDGDLPLDPVLGIAAGAQHGLALKADGTVVAWGFNGHGRTDVPAGLVGVVAVAAGADHSLALKADGTVVAWGYNGNGQSDVPDGLSGVVAVAAGFVHSLALKADGTVVAWGARGPCPPG